MSPAKQFILFIFFLGFMTLNDEVNASDFINNLAITTLSNPTLVQTSQSQVLAYEFHFVNSGDKPLRINRIEVWDQKKPLAFFAGNTLSQNSILYSLKNGPVKTTIKNIELKKDMGAFIFISLQLDKKQSVSNQLQHKIWFTSTTDNNRFAHTALLSYPLSINKDKPVVLGYPLHGSLWLAEGAFSNTSYHRRAILPIDGQFYLAQRYAVDFERACMDGLEVHGDMHDNENWQAYGYEILAVSDGVISKIAGNNAPDNTPPDLPNPPKAIEDAAGNYVIEEIKQNNKKYYVLYAHMQKGSMKVKLGQKITKGQVIGIVGNSGNSSAPHLHLQVTETNEAEKANGVPFVFDTMILQGTANEIDQDYGIWLMPTLKNIRINNVMPEENQLLFFNNRNRVCRAINSSQT